MGVRMNLVNRLMVSVLQLFPKGLVKPFAMRYIAGETLEDAGGVVRDLNSKRMMATVDVLGENVSTKEESLKAVRTSEEVLHTIHRSHLDANLSIKLTQFGLRIDREFCYSNVKHMAEIAGSYGNFVRIDMEDSSTTEATLELYETLRSDGFENVGVVIQASLRRSEEDVKRLCGRQANVRLCKGAYIEPETIAFKENGEIRQNYLKLLELLLGGKCYTGIATHDDFLVHGACRTVEAFNLQKSDYEFQMLYGVRMKFRDQVVADGHRMRIYVPFGQEWHAYSMRRFEENPQIVRYVLRALLSSS